MNSFVPVIYGGDVFRRFHLYTIFEFLTPYSIWDYYASFVYQDLQDPIIQVIDSYVLTPVNTYFIHIIFAVYFIRGAWVTPPNKEKYILPGLVISSLGLRVLPSFVRFLTPYFVQDWGLILHYILFTLLLIYIYIYLGGKAYQAIDPPNPTPNIQKATVLWRINLLVLISWGCILALNHIGKILEYSLFVLNRDVLHFSETGYFFGFIDVFDMYVESQGGIYDVLWYLGNVGFILVPILLFITVLILQGFIGFRYPEGQLIFESQLIRVKKAYESLQAEIDFQQNQIGHSPTFKAIASYLKQIPAEFFSTD
jgi:hypothetical protein